MARLPPSRHTLHRRLRLLDRRTGRHSPLRTTFLPAALAICHSPGLPTQRRRRSDPNATSRTRSPPCGDASSSLSPGPSRDALVATRRSAKRQEFPITDAVRLRACQEIIESTFEESSIWVYNLSFIPYVVVVIDVEPIRERFSTVAPFLDERGRRLVAAAEAFAAGYGGIAAVAMATGMAPSTIGRGLKELAQDEPSERVRRPGGGRKPAIVKDPTLVADLEALVEPTTRGDPESPLRWTCKSVRRLAETLQQQGHQVSRTLVGELLNATGYSLQGNRKTKEGDSHPDRDAQFAHLNAQVAAALADQQPVISVDTKKKVVLRQFLQPASDRARRHAGCHRHRGNATITCSKRLRRRDQTTAPFVDKRRYRGKPLPDGF